MRKKKEMSLKWNKKLVCMLGFIMIVIFAVGCMEGDYVSYDDATGSAYSEETYNDEYDIDYSFRNDDLLESHYEKHGEDMGFGSPEEYEMAANRVVDDEDVLHKIEAEDGDDVYYLEETNEFVVISKDGYIRTYFYPNDGIDYFNRQ